VKNQKPTPEEIAAFPHKNVIVRALGMKSGVEVDLQKVALEDGDIVLLCCDGLSGMVPDVDIAEILQATHRDLRRATQELVDAANGAGGADNITCVLAQVRA
jgi:serine/threonine protein phosphatase PrpC